MGVRLEHAAIYYRNLERAKEFYETYFAAKAGAKYHNPVKGFQSYFLTFEDGCRLEIMTKTSLRARTQELEDWMDDPVSGYVHLAFSVGSKEQVDALTKRLGEDGYTILGAPRTTGDGYYESRVLDFEGNAIEITI